MYQDGSRFLLANIVVTGYQEVFTNISVWLNTRGKPDTLQNIGLTFNLHNTNFLRLDIRCYY